MTTHLNNNKSSNMMKPKGKPNRQANAGFPGHSKPNSGRLTFPGGSKKNVVTKRGGKETTPLAELKLGYYGKRSSNPAGRNP